MTQHKGKLHKMATKWLTDRANSESEGGLGVFADTRFCLDLALPNRTDLPNGSAGCPTGHDRTQPPYVRAR